MTDFSKCTITIGLEFGLIDDKYMTVIVKNADDDIIIIPDKETNTKTVDIHVDLPNRVILKFSGKNNLTDTICDETGKIVKDMYVKLVSFEVDGFPCGEKFLYQKMCNKTDSGEDVFSNFIGFNGTMTIDLPSDNVLTLYQILND